MFSVLSFLGLLGSVGSLGSLDKAVGLSKVEELPLLHILYKAASAICSSQGSLFSCSPRICGHVTKRLTTAVISTFDYGSDLNLYRRVVFFFTQQVNKVILLLCENIPAKSPLFVSARSLLLGCALAAPWQLCILRAARVLGPRSFLLCVWLPLNHGGAVSKLSVASGVPLQLASVVSGVH